MAADQQRLHEIAPGLARGAHDLDDIIGGDVQAVIHLDQVADFVMPMDKVAMGEFRQPGMALPGLNKPRLRIGSEGAIFDRQFHQIEFSNRCRH
ncbi:MAG: hypothetical protein AB7E24_21530, partial [Novosphingobium sp.]